MSDSNNTQVKTQTRQVIIPYDELVGYFIDAGMAVDDATQEFELYIRRSFSIGDRDVLVGRVKSDNKLVLQFNEVVVEPASG